MFFEPILKHPPTIAWFLEKTCSIFESSDFIERMSKLRKRYWLETDKFCESNRNNIDKMEKCISLTTFFSVFHHWEQLHET